MERGGARKPAPRNRPSRVSELDLPRSDLFRLFHASHRIRTILGVMPWRFRLSDCRMRFEEVNSGRFKSTPAVSSNLCSRLLSRLSSGCERLSCDLLGTYRYATR